MNERNDTGSGTTAEHVDGRISHSYDWAETNPTTAVVETLAVAANSEPLDTDPLYEAVDPDALDRLLSSTDAETPTDLRVSFDYGCFRVEVHGSGEVAVRPADGETFPA